MAAFSHNMHRDAPGRFDTCTLHGKLSITKEQGF